jgi:hypothetical protein
LVNLTSNANDEMVPFRAVNGKKTPVQYSRYQILSTSLPGHLVRRSIFRQITVSMHFSPSFITFWHRKYMLIHKCEARSSEIDCLVEQALDISLVHLFFDTHRQAALKKSLFGERPLILSFIKYLKFGRSN